MQSQVCITATLVYDVKMFVGNNANVEREIECGKLNGWKIHFVYFNLQFVRYKIEIIKMFNFYRYSPWRTNTAYMTTTPGILVIRCHLRCVVVNRLYLLLHNCYVVVYKSWSKHGRNDWILHAFNITELTQKFV